MLQLTFDFGDDDPALTPVETAQVLDGLASDLDLVHRQRGFASAPDREYPTTRPADRTERPAGWSSSG